MWQRGGLTHLQIGVVLESIDVAHGEDPVRWKSGFFYRQAERIGVPGVCDEDLSFAVVEDVGDFGSDQVEIDRRQIHADLLHGQVKLQRFARVGQHRGDRVATLEAESA